MIALQALFVAAGYLHTLPAHSAAQADDLNAPHAMPQETVLSPLLHSQGNVVEVVPTGQAIRTTAIMRGKRFEWLGKIDNRVAREVREVETATAPNVDSLNVEELAEYLR